MFMRQTSSNFARVPHRGPAKLPARRPVRLAAAALLAFAATLAPAGCQKTVTSDRPERIVRSTNDRSGTPDVLTPGGGGNGPTAPIPFDATDPCDGNLHELSGLFLEYWLVNRRLPAALDDLRPLADPSQQNAFTCPFAKRPYTYLPQAARMVGSVPRLVVYAPAPGNDGLHRAILMRVPQGSQAPATWVVKLTEIEIQGQLGSMPPPSVRAPSTQPAR